MSGRPPRWNEPDPKTGQWHGTSTGADPEGVDTAAPISTFQAPDESIRARSPLIAIGGLIVAIAVAAVVLVPRAQVATSATTAPSAVATTSAIPTTTSRAAVPTTTSAAAPAVGARIVDKSVSVEATTATLCTISFRWVIADQRPSDAITIVYTGHTPSPREQSGISALIKDGAITRSWSQNKGAGVMTAEVTNLAGRAPDTDTRLSASC
jgi:hypothetical protein